MTVSGAVLVCPLALLLGVLAGLVSALSFAFIHRSAWKGGSRKFGT